MKIIQKPLSLAVMAFGMLLMPGCTLDPMELPDETLTIRPRLRRGYFFFIA